MSETVGGVERSRQVYKLQDGLPAARLIESVNSDRSGAIIAIDAMEVGLAAAILGSGRVKKGDAIDHAVGIVLQRKVGDAVSAGDPLFTLHANDSRRLEEARERVRQAVTVGDGPVQSPTLIRRIIRDSESR